MGPEHHRVLHDNHTDHKPDEGTALLTENRSTHESAMVTMPGCRTKDEKGKQEVGVLSVLLSGLSN